MDSKLWLGRIIVLILFVCVSSTLADSQSTRAAARAQCNRECQDVNLPVCANNGITYNNSCRFQCAKAGNSRLKEIKKGTCAGTSLREYRGQTAPTPRPTPAPSSNRGGGSGWDSWFRF